MERLIGKYCKIVTKEPGEERACVITGTLEDVDYKDGFILVDSTQGLGCLRINTIVAIKPGHKKGHDKKKIKDDDEAIVGIGTLIIFIAMILVAAVAASVIIQTSETLQQRAQTVGTQTIREVSSGIVIDSVTGFTNVDRTRIEYLAILARPRAGSKDIDLNLTTVSVLHDSLNILQLNPSLVVSVNTDNASIFDTPVESGSSFKIIDNLTSGTYGIVAVHDADESITSTGGMNRGDRVMILVNLTAVIPDSNGLETRDRIYGRIQPETGASGVYDSIAPATYTERIVDLW